MRKTYTLTTSNRHGIDGIPGSGRHRALSGNGVPFWNRPKETGIEDRVDTPLPYIATEEK